MWGMTTTPTYDFTPLKLEDLTLLAAWQDQPHVRKWWDADASYDAADLAGTRVRRWIVSTKGQPFGFIQDYTVHGWPDHHFAGLPQGIDQYIGVPDMVGIGHGTAFIAARMRMLFDAGAPVIATDPHPDNTRAVAVYQKLGFQVFGPPQKTAWGLILPMQVKA